MKLRTLLLTLTTGVVLFNACANPSEPSVSTKTLSSVSTVKTGSELDQRFSDAVEKYVKQYPRWALGEKLGPCLIKNAGSITKKAKEAVIEYGLEKAFDELSGEDLASLSTTWTICETKVEGAEAKTAASVPPSPTPVPPSTPSVAAAPESTFKSFDFFECTTTSNPQPMFTSPIIPMELILHTVPPGTAASGMLKPHGYFFVKHDDSWSGGGWSDYPRSVPVTAPITSWLRQVYPYRSGTYGKDVMEPPIEYMLIFEVSCEVYYKLDHLGPLSDTIEAIGPFPVGESTRLSTPLKIEGGELVSYWSGVNPGGNVDIGVYNTTEERTFVNQNRYSDGHHDPWLYEDCPFDYFNEELSEKYHAMFGDLSTGQIVETKSCRISADSDVPNTVQGMWFEPEKYASAFSLSTSLSGWVRATFKEHAETGGEFEIILAPEDPTYIEPLEVTSEHCYQSYTPYFQQENLMYVYLKLLSPTDLQVEYGTGTCEKRIPIETLTLVR